MSDMTKIILNVTTLGLNTHIDNKFRRDELGLFFKKKRMNWAGPVLHHAQHGPGSTSDFLSVHFKFKLYSPGLHTLIIWAASY